MSKRRKRNLLVPEAREALEQMKQLIVASTSEKTPGRAPDNASDNPAKTMAKSIGVPYREADNGDMKARDAGKIGGNMGGPMVKRLISMAKQELKNGPM